MVSALHLRSTCLVIALFADFVTAQSGTHAPTTSGQPTQVSDARLGLMLQRGDRLTGLEVTDSARQRIGRIEDFVLRSDGTIAYAVLASADDPSKLYPVPWSALQIEQPIATGATHRPAAARPESVVLAAPQNRMRAAPSFDRREWPKDGEGTAFTDADRHFGAVHPTYGASASDSARTHTALLFRASALRNQAVNGSADDLVGSLDTLLFDTTNGRVSYAALALPGGRVVALPWGALQADRRAGKNAIRTSATAEQLKVAPQFKPGDEQWKVMSDPQWVGELYAYYALQPYWHDDLAPLGPRN